MCPLNRSHFFEFFFYSIPLGVVGGLLSEGEIVMENSRITE